MSKVLERTAQIEQLVKKLQHDIDVMTNSMGPELAMCHINSKLERFQELLGGYEYDLLSDLENEYKAGYEAGRSVTSYE